MVWSLASSRMLWSDGRRFLVKFRVSESGEGAADAVIRRRGFLLMLRDGRRENEHEEIAIVVGNRRFDFV